MMPEFSSFVTGYPSHPPKFALTQRVLISDWDDQGAPYTEQAWVVGFFYDPTTSPAASWTYVIAIYALSYHHGLTLPYFSTAHESEITLLE